MMKNDILRSESSILGFYGHMLAPNSFLAICIRKNITGRRFRNSKHVGSDSGNVAVYWIQIHKLGEGAFKYIGMEGSSGL